MIELDNVFIIDNDFKADWAIEKISEERSERDRLIELAKSQIENLKQTISDIENKCDIQTAYLENALFEYFKTCKHKNTKTTESYKLLKGNLVYKKPKLSMVRDDAVLINWCKSAGKNQYVKTEEKLDWAELKKTCSICGDVVSDENGEIIEGISVVEEEGKFEIKEN